jgi:uncharacterized membrane protein YukC
MDAIDITSSEFSLGNIPDLNDISPSSMIVGDNSDYTMYIYIGIAILVLIISFFIYKFYFNKQKQVTFQDNLDECYDGFCPR